MTRKQQRSELELIDDRQKLAALALKNPGASSTDLSVLFAEKHGKVIPPRTIRYDLKTLKDQWKSSADRDIERLRAIEFQRLDQLEQEAWDMFRRSQQPKTKQVVERLAKQIASNAGAELAGSLARELADANAYVTEEILETIIADAIERSLDSGDDEETFISKIVETTEESIGDLQTLALIHKIQQDRRKLEGVYAPELYAVHINKKIEVKGYKGGWSPDDWDNEVIDGESEIITDDPVSGYLPDANE